MNVEVGNIKSSEMTKELSNHETHLVKRRCSGLKAKKHNTRKIEDKGRRCRRENMLRKKHTVCVYLYSYDVNWSWRFYGWLCVCLLVILRDMFICPVSWATRFGKWNADAFQTRTAYETAVYLLWVSLRPLSFSSNISIHLFPVCAARTYLSAFILETCSFNSLLRLTTVDYI